MKRMAALALAAACAARACASVAVDVLVAYDASAARWLAGEGLAAQGFAESQVALANEVLANSGLADDFSFRLAGVHLGGFEYVAELGLDGALESAIGSPEAEWAALRAARDAAGADVAVVLADTGIKFGDMGWAASMRPQVQYGGEGEYVRRWGLEFDVAGDWLEWFADRAYAIVDVAAARGGTIFVHEVGHVMGAGHADLATLREPGPQLYRYSAGVMAQGSDGVHYATVMGYDNDETPSSPRYEVLPFFSGPGVRNPKTGDALGDESHDNVRTLRNTCRAVAAFRPAAGAAAPSPAEFKAKKTAFVGAVSDGGEVAGVAEFSVAATKKGFSKVSGSVTGLDGRTRRLKSVKCAVSSGGDGVARVVLDGLAVKGFDGLLSATLGGDGSISGATLGGMEIVSAEKGVGRPSAGFYIDGDIPELQGLDVVREVSYGGASHPLLPTAGSPEPVSTDGKWKASAKAGRIKLVKDRKSGAASLVPVLGKNGANTNLSALKLSYQPKTGVFKGSFCVYALDGGRLRKYSFKVTGVALDGEGRGVAVCKKAGVSCRVTVK